MTKSRERDAHRRAQRRPRGGARKTCDRHRREIQARARSAPDARNAAEKIGCSPRLRNLLRLLSEAPCNAGAAQVAAQGQGAGRRELDRRARQAGRWLVEFRDSQGFEVEVGPRVRSGGARTAWMASESLHEGSSWRRRSHHGLDSRATSAQGRGPRFEMAREDAAQSGIRHCPDGVGLLMIQVGPTPTLSGVKSSRGRRAAGCGADGRAFRIDHGREVVKKPRPRR